MAVAASTRWIEFMSGMGLLFVVIFGYICAVAFLFWRGLANPIKSSWVMVIIGIILLAAASVCVGSVALTGRLGGAIAFLIGLPAIVTALLTGTILVVKLSGKRKLVGVFLALGFPLALFLSIQIGD